MGKSFELLSSRFIQVKCRIRVAMQKGWWYVVRYFTLDRSFNDVSFTLRPSHDNNLFSLLDCIDTHCYRSFWDIIDSIEGLWSVSSCKSVQIYQPGTTVDWWRWLVKTNVPCPSDSQNLNINASVRFNFLFIILTKFGHLIPFDLSVWNVDVLFQNIDVTKQILPHVIIVRLRVIVANWVVLIKIESDYVFEGKAFLFMKPHQFSVK